MSISELLNNDFLRKGGALRRNPEFAAELTELNHASRHTAKMLKAGKLTKQQAADLEAHYCEKLIDALPVDDFGEMMRDGRLAELQALAGYEGERDAADVADSRKSLMKIVQKDALDEAWLDQRITHEHYAKVSAEIDPSESMNNRIADGDHDGAASEFFASRHDTAKDHDKELNSYLDKTYGKDRPGREADSAPKVVGKETRTETRKGDDGDLSETQRAFRDKLGEITAQEPRSVVDANGITDIDLLAEQEG